MLCNEYDNSIAKGDPAFEPSHREIFPGRRAVDSRQTSIISLDVDVGTLFFVVVSKESTSENRPRV